MILREIWGAQNTPKTFNRNVVMKISKTRHTSYCFSLWHHLCWDGQHMLVGLPQLDPQKRKQTSRTLPVQSLRVTLELPQIALKLLTDHFSMLSQFLFSTPRSPHSSSSPPPHPMPFLWTIGSCEDVLILNGYP